MTPQTADSKAKKKEQSQANRLVKVANSIELFHDANGDAFATVPIKGHGETYKVRSRAFKRWLAEAFYRTTQHVPQTQAMADAVNTLEGLAIFDGKEIETHVRIAGHDGLIYLDLANDDWQAVEISPDGWMVVDDPPVKFLRPAAMLGLPRPVHGGSINELRQFVNVASDQDFQLLVAFIVCAIRAYGPYLILNIGGEKGSAKTWLIRFIRLLIDPNRSLVRSAPRNEDDLLIAAKHSWLMTSDNLSGLPQWLSDTWCRLATGGGISKRELYTDDDEIVLDAQRPIILAGITEIVTRSDLVDRVIRLECPAIPEDQYKPERILRVEFEAARPRILGAILDGVSAALRNIGTFDLGASCRMIDGAEWVSAAWPAFGWERGDFLGAYKENRRQGRESAIEAEPVGPVLVRMLERLGGSWKGTATELWDDLNKERDGDQSGKRPPKGWPGAPNILTNRLKVLVSDLRETGINVVFLGREDRTRRKIIKITTIEPRQDSQSGPPANGPDDAPERSPNGPEDEESATPNDWNDGNDSSALPPGPGDPGGILARMVITLSEQYSDDPELGAMLDQLCELTDLLHEEDEHPIELAVQLAYERVVADREKERGAA